MQFDDPNSQPKMNDQTPLTDAVEASLVPFVLATPHHAPAEVVNQADSSHSGQNSRKLTEAQLEAIAGGINNTGGGGGGGGGGCLSSNSKQPIYC